MAELERKVVVLRYVKQHTVLVCRCGSNMFQVRTPEPRAVCYNKACEHYRVTYTVEYPDVLLVQYADTVPIAEH